MTYDARVDIIDARQLDNILTARLPEDVTCRMDLGEFSVYGRTTLHFEEKHRKKIMSALSGGYKLQQEL